MILQRLWQPAVLNAVGQLNSRGKRTVFDVDDDYWSIPTVNPSYAGWQTPGALENLASVIKAVGGVTTTTRPLAERLRQLNSNVKVIPNTLPEEFWPTHAKPLDHGGPLVIGWAGGISHYLDLREMAAILPQILDRYPQAEVRLAGANPAWFPAHDRISFPEPVPIEQYAGLLGGFDIGLAPLEDTRFNESKSDLKVLEYSMIGLPVIASKVPAYLQSVAHGETGFLARSPKDWLKHLKSLVEQPGLRAQMGQRSRAWAESRLISGSVGLWEDAYGLRE
jgi:glycosyltransferase involved in cell wall biosynthesis